MNTADDYKGGNHLGFECATAASSLCLSKKYVKTLKTIENKLSIATSTPNNRMDVSFTKCFSENSVGFVVDNDSGYVSINPESSMDYPSVITNVNCSTTNSKHIYLSEDALLEKPEICPQQNGNEYDHLFFLSNSVVAPSCESEKTTFSGFEDTDASEKDVSGDSDVISKISPIKFCVSKEVGEETVQNVGLDESGNENVCDANNTVEYSVAKTPEKAYKNSITSYISPDMFSDEDEPVKNVDTNQILIEKYIHPNDKKLIKNVQQGLSGVFPPPSVTFFCMSITEMLERISNNKHLFADRNVVKEETERSLLVTISSKEEIKEWPQVLEQRYHGLW